MVDISLSLLGSNGDVIALDNNDDFVAMTGLMGLGIPSTQLRIDNSAGDGGTWRSTRRGVRTIDMPLAVFGSDRGDVESKLRRVANALNDRIGTPKLLATYSDGTAYDIEVHYSGGAETTFGAEGSLTFCQWGLSLQCPDPFWTSTNAVSFSLSADGTTKGLLPELDRLLVKSSQVIGSTAVNNPGDVAAYPTWVIDGPSTAVSITLGGIGFTYNETTIAGNKITIDTKTASVTNGSGVNKYAYLGTAPKLFSLPPGTSTVAISVTGSSTTTKISGFWKPRREVLF